MARKIFEDDFSCGPPQRYEAHWRDKYQHNLDPVMRRGSNQPKWEWRSQGGDLPRNTAPTPDVGRGIEIPRYADELSVLAARRRAESLQQNPAHQERLRRLEQERQRQRGREAEYEAEREAERERWAAHISSLNNSAE